MKTPWTVIDRCVQFGQLAVLIGGIIKVSVMVGARDQVLNGHSEALKELRDITAQQSQTSNSLQAVQAGNIASLTAIQREIDEVQVRLRTLENKR